MKPQIFFDERWIGEHGIGRVAKEIQNKLLPIPLKMKGKPVDIIDPFRFFWCTLFLPKDSIILSPGFNAPLFCFRPFYFIVHDLNHIDRAENTSLLKKIYYHLILKRACIFAKKVFTVSEFSKNRIAQWASIAPQKIINISNGVDSNFSPIGEKYNFEYPYFLCVSNRKAHKNEIRIINAFAKAQIPDNVKLLFTGSPNIVLNTLIINLKVEHKVCFTGRIAEEELPKLYRTAQGLIFPSLYEGFGLPVLEAMASGIPVITSDTTSLVEVSNGAALLVNPLEEDEISEAIQKLQFDNNLRQELITKGLEVAKKFSWEIVMDNIMITLSKYK